MGAGLAAAQGRRVALREGQAGWRWHRGSALALLQGRVPPGLSWHNLFRGRDTAAGSVPHGCLPFPCPLLTGCCPRAGSAGCSRGAAAASPCPALPLTLAALGNLTTSLLAPAPPGRRWPCLSLVTATSYHSSAPRHLHHCHLPLPTSDGALRSCSPHPGDVAPQPRASSG